MLVLQSVNHERWGLKDLWVYTPINKANSKFFWQKFTLSRDASADANP